MFWAKQHWTHKCGSSVFHRRMKAMWVWKDMRVEMVYLSWFRCSPSLTTAPNHSKPPAHQLRLRFHMKTIVSHWSLPSDLEQLWYLPCDGGIWRRLSLNLTWASGGSNAGLMASARSIKPHTRSDERQNTSVFLKNNHKHSLKTSWLIQPLCLTSFYVPH